MTLAELLAEPLPGAETLRGLGIVMQTSLAQRVVNVQAWYGDQTLTAFPAGLDDGRWLFPADILPDCIYQGGAYYPGFSRLNASRFDEIEVVPVSSTTLADPQPAQLEPEPNPAESGQ